MAQFLFDDPKYTARVQERALVEHAEAPTLGLAEQAGLGVMRGGAQMARTVGLAAGAVAGLGGTDAQDAVFEWVDDNLTDAVEYWTPDPRTTTTAGRIVGGLAEAALPLMLAAGNPVPLMADATMRSAERVSDAGAGPLTSAAVGTLEAAAIAAGFRIPMVGSTLARSLALGVAANPVLGAVTEGAQGALLSATGNEAAAAQLNPFDLERRGVETLLGLAFGGIGHGVARAARRAALGELPEPPSLEPGNPHGIDVDAVLTYRAAASIEAAAPGMPVDLRSANAHDAAMRESLAALAEGREPNIAQHLQEATFAREADADGRMRQASTEAEPMLAEALRELDAYDDALPRRQREELEAARADITDVQDRLAALDEDPVMAFEDGTQARASEIMRRYDAQLEEAKTTYARAAEAAIACFLRTAA